MDCTSITTERQTTARAAGDDGLLGRVRKDRPQRRVSAGVMQEGRAMLRRFFSKHPYEVQFWGYEIGNLLAALAAVGGLGAILSGSGRDGLFPDLIVPVALACLIAMLALGNRVLRAKGRQGFVPVLNRAVGCLGIGLLLWAFVVGENWLSTAAIAFLTGSALIRLTDRDPVYLKTGACFLILGGVALLLFGVTGGAGHSVDAVTAVTGLYVAGAGVLTYVGGVAMERTRTGPPTSRDAGWLTALTSPFDSPLLWCAQRLVEPAIFWLPAKMKSSKPFLTSMWARLPFRLATATAAALTLTPEGFVFALANLLWATGDIAIGALDWAA